jgi:hypothetical protein
MNDINKDHDGQIPLRGTLVSWAGIIGRVVLSVKDELNIWWICLDNGMVLKATYSTGNGFIYTKHEDVMPSDGMTDKRSQSEQVLTKVEINEARIEFRKRLRSNLYGSQRFLDMTIKEFEEFLDYICDMHENIMRSIER